MSQRALPYDPQRLRYFLAECEHCGTSKAASFIRAAQLALTRQIQLLEQRFDISLFRCPGRSEKPTDTARHLVGRIMPHLAAIERARAAICANVVRQDFATKEAI
jgi:DNA-binding transcriptional LysR family regulator